MYKKKAIPIYFFALLLGCNLLTDSTPDRTDRENFVIDDGILYSLYINKSKFNYSDTLKVTFEVTNLKLTDKTFYFPNVQQFGLDLIDDQGIKRVSHPMFVQPAGSSFTLTSKEAKTFSHISLFNDWNGNYIEVGDYKLSAYLLGGHPEVMLEFTLE